MASEQPSSAIPRALGGVVGAQVLVLGTVHLANNLLDAVKAPIDDVLAAPRQQQINTVVDALAKFEPTRVGVEAMADATEWNDLYRSYRRGEHVLGRNEIEQFGFRLADRFDIPELDLINASAQLDWDGLKQLMQDDGSVGAFFDNARRGAENAGAELSADYERRTIAATLANCNDPQQLDASHQTYLHWAIIRSATVTGGPDYAASWYRRNLRMFANIAHAITSPGDRMLVVVGSGHAKLLRDFIGGSGLFELVDPLPYLAAAQA